MRSARAVWIRRELRRRVLSRARSAPKPQPCPRTCMRLASEPWTGSDLRKPREEHRGRESRAWQDDSESAVGQLHGLAAMPGHHPAAIPALSQLYAAPSRLAAQPERTILSCDTISMPLTRGMAVQGGPSAHLAAPGWFGGVRETSSSAKGHRSACLEAHQ